MFTLSSVYCAFHRVCTSSTIYNNNNNNNNNNHSKRTITRASHYKHYKATATNTSHFRAAGTELIQAWLTGDVNTFLYFYFYIYMYCEGPQSAVCHDNEYYGEKCTMESGTFINVVGNQKKTKANVTLWFPSIYIIFSDWAFCCKNAL